VGGRNRVGTAVVRFLTPARAVLDVRR